MMPATRSPRPRSPALKDEQVEQEVATASTTLLWVQLARLGKGFHHNKYKNTKNKKGKEHTARARAESLHSKEKPYLEVDGGWARPGE